MDTSVTYEKVYFQDDYRQQLEELRSRYRTRTQRALGVAPIDKHPVSNISEIIYLHNDGNGGVTVTTGDFVEYFNYKYGANDRLGAMRRSLHAAECKAEKNEQAIKKHRISEAKKEERTGFADRIRTTGRRMAFVHAIFIMMLALSAVMLTASSAILGDVKNDVSALETRVAAMAPAEADKGAALLENAPGYDLLGNDTVEIYPAEKEPEVGISALLNALFSFGGK